MSKTIITLNNIKIPLCDVAIDIPSLEWVVSKDIYPCATEATKGKFIFYAYPVEDSELWFHVNIYYGPILIIDNEAVQDYKSYCEIFLIDLIKEVLG